MNSLFKEAQFSAYKRNSKYEKAISPYIKYWTFTIDAACIRNFETSL